MSRGRRAEFCGNARAIRRDAGHCSLIVITLTRDSGLQIGRASMAKFELYKSSNGEYRWRLRADNGNIIATGGEGYASKATAQAGIESVRKNAPNATVEEV
jgi:uncharacterized protein YegP (UPF0339 family)